MNKDKNNICMIIVIIFEAVLFIWCIDILKDPKNLYINNNYMLAKRLYLIIVKPIAYMMIGYITTCLVIINRKLKLKIICKFVMLLLFIIFIVIYGILLTDCFFVVNKEILNIVLFLGLIENEYFFIIIGITWAILMKGIRNEKNN